MDVVAERKGGVLGQFTIIKEDHFPNCQYTELEPRFYPQVRICILNVMASASRQSERD